MDGREEEKEEEDGGSVVERGEGRTEECGDDGV